MQTRQNSRGVTLVELLVVMAVVALLAGLLLPVLAMARESARNSTCKSNLRQFGVAMHAYADTHNGFLCSGAFEWKRDGVPTEAGWVADMVNNNIIVGQMLCPSNANSLSETYRDLLDADVTSTFSCAVDHSGSMPRTLDDGTLFVNPCRIILGTWTGSWVAPWGTTYTGGTPLPPGSEDRRRLVEEAICNAGYNTNYVATWWLVRAGVALDSSGNLVSLKGKNDLGYSCPAGSNGERASTLGPLNRRLIETGAAPSSNVPLLADGMPTDLDRGVLSQSLGPHSAGIRLVESFTDGPVLNTTMKPPVFPPGTPRKGPAGWLSTWANETLQDYRDLAPVHGRQSNVLMADGSVQSFRDDKDGFLNSGFDPAVYTGTLELGITDKTVELPPQQLFSRFSLRKADQLLLK